MDTLSSLWLILAVLLCVVEAATPALVCIWFAAGSLTAFIVSLFVPQLWIQVVIFILFSVALLIATRPLVKKYVYKKTIATNADRIIGAEGIVLIPLDPIENKGQVKVMGQIWSAKSADGTNLQPNTAVIIKGIEGVKVIVEAKNN